MDGKCSHRALQAKAVMSRNDPGDIRIFSVFLPQTLLGQKNFLYLELLVQDIFPAISILNPTKTNIVHQN